MDSTYWIFHTNNNMGYVAFLLWLLLLFVIPFQGSSLLEHVSVLHSCVWPDNIPLYGQTTFHLSIHQLMSIWVISTLELLWIMLLWWYIVHEHKCSFLLDVYVEVTWLDHMVILCFSLKKLRNYFQFEEITKLFYQQCLLIFPHSCQCLLVFIYLM